MDMQM